MKKYNFCWFKVENNLLDQNILLRASEVGPLTNPPGLRGATRHGVRDPLVRSQVDYNAKYMPYLRLIPMKTNEGVGRDNTLNGLLVYYHHLRVLGAKM